jgi:hypothetical protein
MIDSTSSSVGTSGANALPPELSKSAGQRATIAQDRLSTDGADQLRQLIAGEPEIRPEMVEKGRVLAADPSYPPSDLIRQLAGMLVNSSDPSSDQS